MNFFLKTLKTLLFSKIPFKFWIEMGFIVLLYNIINPIWSVEPIQLSKYTNFSLIGENLDILKDKSKELKLDQIIHSDQFSPSKDPAPNFGNIDIAIWGKFIIHNDTNFDKDLLLVLDFTLVDEIILFIPENNQYISKINGRNIKFSQRDVPSKEPIFLISIPKDQKLTYHFRAYTNGNLAIPLRLTEPNLFQQNIHRRQMLQGFYYGMIFVMIVYNCFLYISLKETSFLLYVIYMISSNLFLQASIRGHTLEYLFPEYPSIAILLHNFFYISSIFLIYPFTIKALVVKKYSIAIYKTLKFLMYIIGSIVLLSPFLPYRTINSIASILAYLTFIIISIVSISIAIIGYRPAYYFFIAYLVLVTGATISIMRVMGYVGVNFFTTYGFQISQAIEVVLMSFTLADRFNLIRKEKEEVLSYAMKTEMDNRKYLAIHQELEMAKKIQKTIIPNSIPQVVGLTAEARYLPMTYVGGDFYDFHKLNEYSLAAIIADVTGHGVPAALVSAMLKVAYTMQKNVASEPAKVLKSINKILVNPDYSQLLTATSVIINTKKKILQIANAGHPSLYIFNRIDLSIYEYRPRGKMIGLLPDLDLDTHEIQLQSKDRIILYTDGITECINQEQESIGNERIAQFIQDNKDMDCENFTNSLILYLKKWTENYSPIDDMTLIVIDVD